MSLVQLQDKRLPGPGPQRLVIEAYMMLDRDGDGVAKRFRIIKAGNALLDIEEVDRQPFIPFVPLPIPHAFLRQNFADKLCDTQNAQNGPDQAQSWTTPFTNNPRYMVVKGGSQTHAN